MKPVIYHFTNIAPLYRRRLWITLLESNFFAFYNFFGKNRHSGIETLDFHEDVFVKHKPKLKPITNYWVKGKYLIWQSGVLRRVTFNKIDMVIILGEFIIVSNWLVAIICRIRGIKVVFRGHGMYGNEGPIKLFFRKRYYHLANAHLLYERRAKKIMVSKGFKPENLHVYFNSLDYDTHKKLREANKNLKKKDVFDFFIKPNATTFIFVGRLTKVKKIDMVIKAISKLNALGQEINLLLIGDGTEKNSLEDLASKILIKGSYHFYGACYDEHELGKYLATSDVCVSPGNVGLTAIHSLSSGTPVCTHKNFENQMPEVEALEEGITGIFFNENDLNDLVQQLQKWVKSEKRDKEQIRKSCFKIIDDYYNPYYQAKVIENLVNNGNALI